MENGTLFIERRVSRYDMNYNLLSYFRQILLPRLDEFRSAFPPDWSVRGQPSPQWPQKSPQAFASKFSYRNLDKVSILSKRRRNSTTSREPSRTSPPFGRRLFGGTCNAGGPQKIRLKIIRFSHRRKLGLILVQLLGRGP